tara:strand:+ start:258 stop:461 length:204 start_codon:yes stop_codon:yes gene_type:complete
MEGIFLTFNKYKTMEVYIVVLFWYETPEQFKILKAFKDEEAAKEYVSKCFEKMDSGDVIKIRKLAIT